MKQRKQQSCHVPGITCRYIRVKVVGLPAWSRVDGLRSAITIWWFFGCREVEGCNAVQKPSLYLAAPWWSECRLVCTAGACFYIWDCSNSIVGRFFCCWVPGLLC
jgi:hypothetical protein